MKTIILVIIFVLLAQNLLSETLFDTTFKEIRFVSNNVENDKLRKINEIKYLSSNQIFSKILTSNEYKIYLKSVDENLINTFIKNIIIEDEKIINNNYSSKIKINFDKPKIISYLRNKQISYVEYFPKNILTIISEDKILSKNLFNNYNQHYKFLKKNNKFNFYQIPKLDINDKFLLTNKDLENKNYIKIDNFIKKYSTKEAIIIISTEIDNHIEYKVYLYSNRKYVKVDNQVVNKYNYYEFFYNLKNKIIDKWKLENNIQNKTLDTLVCEINYFNLLELKQIKIFINEISIIKTINLKNISFKKNKYDIIFYGNKKILKQLFNIKGLMLIVDNNNCKIFLK